jgi:hypothetical protein
MINVEGLRSDSGIVILIVLDLYFHLGLVF